MQKLYIRTYVLEIKIAWVVVVLLAHVFLVGWRLIKMIILSPAKMQQTIVLHKSQRNLMREFSLEGRNSVVGVTQISSGSIYRLKHQPEETKA